MSGDSLVGSQGGPAAAEGGRTLRADQMQEYELLQPQFDSTDLFQEACQDLAEHMGWKIIGLGFNHVEFEASRYCHLCVFGELAIRQLCDALLSQRSQT